MCLRIQLVDIKSMRIPLMEIFSECKQLSTAMSTLMFSIEENDCVPLHHRNVQPVRLMKITI